VDRSFAERSIPGLYDVLTLGLNYRMSDINAALGRQQLSRIEEILARRRANFAQLRAGLQGLPHVRVLDAADPLAQSSHYCLSAVLTGPLQDRRNEIVARLNQAGVGTSIYYPQPVPRMTYYRVKYGYDAAAYPHATEISDSSIALPVGPHLTSDDAAYVAASFAAIMREIC
jgi:dTDP-4-amino-4,6-dideoxygalactose transaminase